MYYVLAVAVLWLVWQILKHYKVLSFAKGNKIFIDDADERAWEIGQRDRAKRLLGYYSLVCACFSRWLFDVHLEKEYKFAIERLNIASKPLGRLLTPCELRGKYIIILLSGVFFGLLALLFKFFLPLFILFAFVASALLLWYIVHRQYYTTRINDEDLLIDLYFVDLFLLMYSGLKKGSRARVMPVMESYVASLKQIGDRQAKLVMLKFSQFFLNNLSMYEDSEAVKRLCDKYRSATIVNFSNVASQSLQGVDTSEALLSFKMQLLSKRQLHLEEKSKKLVARGEKAILLIFVILFQFVVLGWLSKLPLGALQSIWGGWNN